MSEINLIIVKGSDFYYTKMHYREIIKAIKNPEAFKKLLKNKHYLDAGYLIFDFNNQTIINSNNQYKLKKNIF